MSLAEEAEARKARLAALRARKAGHTVDGLSGAIGILSLRNFDPETRTLRKHTAADSQEETLEKNVQGLAQRVLAADEARRAAELDLLNIAPKRANWDLKRDLEKKLQPLERKTKESIYALVRERLGAEKDGAKDISSALKAREAADDAPSSEEED